MTIVMRMLPALPLAGLFLAATAHAETRTSANVGVEGGYGSNPLLGQQTGDAGSLTARLEPVVTIIGPTTKLDLNGRLEEIVFTNGFNDMTNWSIGSALALTLTPRSNLSFTAGYSSQVQSAISSILPIPGQEQPSVDPSSAELAGQRIKTLNSEASFSTQISARNSVTASVFVNDVSFGSVLYNGNSYIAYGASLGLSHAMNSRTSVGASVGFQKSDYDSAANGSFQQISPSANVALILSPRLTLNVSAGISFSETKLPATSSHSTHFSGSADLCYKGARANFCANAERSVGSSARTGNSTITGIGVSYSYKLTARSSLSLRGQYTESKSVDAIALNTDYGYGVASASYQRELGRRLSFSVSARYTEPFKSFGGSRRGFYGGAGVNYRLGR